MISVFLHKFRQKQEQSFPFSGRTVLFCNHLLLHVPVLTTHVNTPLAISGQSMATGEGKLAYEEAIPLVVQRWTNGGKFKNFEIENFVQKFLVTE